MFAGRELALILTHDIYVSTTHGIYELNFS